MATFATCEAAQEISKDRRNIVHNNGFQTAIASTVEWNGKCNCEWTLKINMNKKQQTSTISMKIGIKYGDIMYSLCSNGLYSLRDDDYSYRKDYIRRMDPLKDNDIIKIKLDNQNQTLQFEVNNTKSEEISIRIRNLRWLDKEKRNLIESRVRKYALVITTFRRNTKIEILNFSEKQNNAQQFEEDIKDNEECVEEEDINNKLCKHKNQHKLSETVEKWKYELLETKNKILKDEKQTLGKRNETLARARSLNHRSIYTLENTNKLLETKNKILKDEKQRLKNTNETLENTNKLLETKNKILKDEKQALGKTNERLKNANKLLKRLNDENTKLTETVIGLGIENEILQKKCEILNEKLSETEIEKKNEIFEDDMINNFIDEFENNKTKIMDLLYIHNEMKQKLEVYARNKDLQKRNVVWALYGLGLFGLVVALIMTCYYYY